MFRIDPGLLKDLYGKDMIAFGTGKIGKAVIPYLARDPAIQLIGVTNSRIVSTDEGVFPGTDLPLRSIQSWAKTAPGASVLVTVLDSKQVGEIFNVCQEAGFQEVIPISPSIVNSIRTMVTAPEDKPIDLLAGDPMLQLIGLANEIHETHMASFSEFKGCHRGRTIAVVGTGPTLNYYSQVKGAPHIGVNTSFKRKQLKFDYYFLNHYSLGVCDELKNYSFVKFFGYIDDVFPECAVEENRARRFFLSVPGRRLHTNIEYYPLAGGFYSVIFNALQFALYTRPKRILLVGCDCAAIGYFNADDPCRGDIPAWLDGYRCFKEFITQHYPDTGVVSINPVGLRGMFHDVYTKNYLDDHPELDPTVCELFDATNYEVSDDI